MLEELGLGEAAAVEVPGALEDAGEEEIFESADGDEVDAEFLFEVGEGGFEAEGNDESSGCEAVAGGVEGGGGFAFVGAGSGGVLAFAWLASAWAGVAMVVNLVWVLEMKKRPAGGVRTGAFDIDF